MILRVEVKLDGRIIRVEEVEVSEKQTTEIWDFLGRAKRMISNLMPANFIYNKGEPK